MVDIGIFWANKKKLYCIEVNHVVSTNIIINSQINYLKIFEIQNTLFVKLHLIKPNSLYVVCTALIGNRLMHNGSVEVI